MKLALATAILAETLPSVSSQQQSAATFSYSALIKNNFQATLGSSSNSRAPAGNGVTMYTGGLGAGGRFTNGGGGGKLTNLANEKRRGALLNLVATEQQELRECDPHSEDPDVGVLSCGEGRYCLESAAVYPVVDTTLGGICIMDPNGQAETMHRQLQMNDTSIIEDIAYLCSGNGTPNNYTTCECENVDVEAYTGTAACTLQYPCLELPDICGANTTVCFSVGYTLSFTAPYTGSVKQCYSFTTPDVFDYCITGAYTGSPDQTACDIEVNGVMCNSCGVGYQCDNSGYPSVTMDCLNTDVGAAFPFCNATIASAWLYSTLTYGAIAEGPCPTGCNLCGEGGMMTNLDVNVSVPTGDSVPCYILQYLSFTGYFADIGQEEVCDLLPPIVAEPCGCTGGIMGNTTTPPIDSPVDAPAGAPTVVSPGPPSETSDVPSEPPVMGGMTDFPTVSPGTLTPPPPTAGADARFMSIGLTAAAAMVVGTLFFSA